MHHLATHDDLARKRIVAAVGRLSERHGLGAPRMIDWVSREPAPTSKSVGDELLVAALAEAVVALTNEIDELRAQLATAKK